METLLVTGGAGFIGSNFVRMALGRGAWRVVIVDALTYAGNLDSLRDVSQDPNFVFVEADIADRNAMEALFREHRPRRVVNFAAESHVDRSIDGPRSFVRTNVQGTFELLEAARGLWGAESKAEREAARFLHVSTDEVYGSLGPEGAFTEDSPYAPNSPYSATKAGADHLVRAYFETFDLPTLVTNCTNNYGPYQFPEKLIPLVLLNALEGKPLPIYGDGGNVRDWIFVEDHCSAVLEVLERGTPGQCYNVGGHSERTNLEVVDAICAHLESLHPAASNAALQNQGHTRYAALKSFVPDRPGHDRRYAMDCSKIEAELGWRPQYDFDSALERTVRWYLEHRDWCEAVQTGTYRRTRLGLEG